MNDNDVVEFNVSLRKRGFQPYVEIRKSFFKKEDIKEIVKKAINKDKIKASVRFNNIFVALRKLQDAGLLSEEDAKQILNL